MYKRTFELLCKIRYKNSGVRLDKSSTPTSSPGLPGTPGEPGIPCEKLFKIYFNFNLRLQAIILFQIQYF